MLMAHTQLGVYKNFFFENFNLNDHIDNFTCTVVLTKNNTIIEIDRGWGGIPETLVINIILSFLLGVCFILVRYFAKDGPLEYLTWLHFIYGNRVRVDTHAKLVQRTNVKQLLSSFGENLSSILPIHVRGCKAGLPTIGSDINSIVPSSSTSALFNDEKSLNNSQKSNSNETINHEHIIIQSDIAHFQRDSSDNLVQNETVFPIGSDRSRFSILQRSDSVYRLHNFLSQLFRLDDVYAKKGRDAYQYLLLQQYIIVLLIILSFICIFVLLPFNLEGGGEGKAFAQTTISNLSNDSSFYWVHAFSATFIGLIGLYFMNYFSKLIKTDNDVMSRTTLLIRRIPPVKDDIDIHSLFIDYFSKNFQNLQICGLQFVHDYRKLDALQYELENIINARQHCQKKNDKSNTPFMLRPYCLGRIGLCCCCCCYHCCCSEKVDGVEYYSKQIDDFRNDINDELKHYSISSPVAAFVTFESESMAMRVFKHFKEEQKKFFILRDCFASFSSDTNQFSLNRSLISYAPHPSDINWYNIGIDMRMLWVRKWLLNIVLMLIFFFLSTPAFLLKAIDILKDKDMITNGIGKFGATLADFLSPFLLMLMAIILPSIVTYVQGRIPYKTISALNHAIMAKVFWFLVMMILVLPSAGFVSINTFLWKGIMADKGFHWNCLFPVDNGAFFVIYTLQAAILGNTVELLRIPETSLYLLYNLILRSSVEYQKARRMITFEFPFGVSYARFLLIFTITVTYSQSCPLIAPAGLLYMLCKHFVDRYNILNAYTPSKINWETHSTAILYILIALIFMLFQLFTVFIVKTSYSNVTIYTFIVLILFTLIFIFYYFYDWFRNINHITYSVTTRNPPCLKQNYCICYYTPQVFLEIQKSSSHNSLATTLSSTCTVNDIV